jgi:hypothetical protein
LGAEGGFTYRQAAGLSDKPIKLSEIHGRIHRQTDREQGDLINLLVFFRNKESRLISSSDWSEVLNSIGYKDEVHDRNI